MREVIRQHGEIILAGIGAGIAIGALTYMIYSGSLGKILSLFGSWMYGGVA